MKEKEKRDSKSFTLRFKVVKISLEDQDGPFLKLDGSKARWQ